MQAKIDDSIPVIALARALASEGLTMRTDPVTGITRIEPIPPYLRASTPARATIPLQAG